ncbi:MAG: M20 family metallopeptidase [Armatimonadota bacterium]|nr:M20 family metallopeptidase [Armatimonadota bacterium]MDR7421359.1 M20 family metallopeptidase [Armatimonadota bacterium]MDR7453309.1 M20 family metallopeptidase [Armatimonadota bacterium]MDR7456491.1 M20 family metallopeptidase [Armatimonadota bacterium]MDR7496242.1 M20 family metallopeptidase [Armatimonadota bacterium]
MRDRIVAAIDAARTELVELARRVHANPEIGFQERQAATWLTETLERHGFAVERGVAGLETAFRAEVRGARDRPAVAVLAEYDALPEIGHACGHNLICTAAVGAGLGLAAVRDALPGRAVVLGTPAEEGGGGKVIMLQGGAFDGIDAAMMFHPAGYTMAGRPSLASYRLQVKFTGKAAHAAAAPDEGINALDALIQTFVAIGLLRQQVRDDARIHGIVTYGGAAPNIIPDRAEAVFTVRAADGAYALEVLHRVVHCAQGAAQATGATLEHVVRKGYDAIKPNRTMADRFARHLERLGYPPDAPPDRPRMGSTDMGDVSQAIPSIHPYVAIGPKDLPGHTVAFREAALSERGMGAMLAAAKALALTAYDLLADPELLAAVRREFEGESARVA